MCVCVAEAGRRVSERLQVARVTRVIKAAKESRAVRMRSAAFVEGMDIWSMCVSGQRSGLVEGTMIV